MKYSDALERLQAAQQIISDTSITREKLGHLQKLLKGINPKLDKVLSRVTKEWDKLARFEKGEVIDLIAHELPEHTKEEKKRKKAFLFFLSSWKDLQSEVLRVRGQLESNQNNASKWGNILGAAKGPLGLITVVAVGWVLLETMSIEIAVKNEGCDTLYPTKYAAIPLPGISLPSDPIVQGQTAIVKLPPLTLDVDGTMLGLVDLSALNFNYTFDVPANVSVSFDGVALIGTKTQLSLGDQKHHDLVLSCQ